jgi:hypothetical protein
MIPTTNPDPLAPEGAGPSLPRKQGRVSAALPSLLAGERWGWGLTASR